MNKKGIGGTGIALIVIIATILIGILSTVSTYNILVSKDLNIENSWAHVQTAYERRLDLIPNLVATVKGAANFEQQTQTQIAAFRSGIQGAKTADELNSIGTGIDKMVSGILISVEAYPDLKATQNFLALQDQLEGTENRIKYERDNYNDAVKTYKQSVRNFPSNILAGIFGFSVDKWEMFEAKSESENVPIVNFN